MCLRVSIFRGFLECLRIVEIVTWREGVGIEPTGKRSTAHPIGFEGRDAHQSHIPPKRRKSF